MEACNSNFTGAITATAQPIFSLPTAVLQYYGIPFGRGSFLYQYTLIGELPDVSLTNPVAIPATNLAVSVSGKTIKVTIPFGATFDGNTVDYIIGGSPRQYNLNVAHGGTTVLSGLLSIDIAATSQEPEAAFSICDAKAS
jgi:hypothetical protein